MFKFQLLIEPHLEKKNYNALWFISVMDKGKQVTQGQEQTQAEQRILKQKQWKSRSEDQSK